METILTHKLNEIGIEVNSFDAILELIEMNKHNVIYGKGVLPLSYIKDIKGLSGIYANTHLKTDEYKEGIAMSYWYDSSSSIIYDSFGEAILFTNDSYFDARSMVLKRDVLDETLTILCKDAFNLALNRHLRVKLHNYTPKYINKNILTKKVYINYINTLLKLRNKLYKLTGTRNYRAVFMGIPKPCNPELYKTNYVAADRDSYIVNTLKGDEIVQIKYNITPDDVRNNTLIYQRYLKEVTYE